MEDFPKTLLYESRGIMDKKTDIYINFDADSQLKNVTKQKKREAEEAEKDRKRRIIDSFVLLGDTTIYDKFVYGVGSKPAAKFIRNEDYIVVKKNADGSPMNPQDVDNTKVTVSEEFVDEIIEEMIG